MIADHDGKVTESEIKIIEEKLKGTDFCLNDFFITKSHNNKIILVIKYASLLAKTIDKIDWFNFEYGDNYVDVIVKRKDFNHPTRWRVYYDEYKSSGGFWESHFHFMIKKTALSQALRLLFADFLYQISYTVYGEGEYFEDKVTKRKKIDKNQEKHNNTEEILNNNAESKLKKYSFDLLEEMNKKVSKK
ncbi:MAG: recombinase RecT [Candidatus Aenigmatarchaeota archaeon]